MEIKLVDIIDSFLTNQFQDIEDSLFSLLNAYDIDTQEGTTLNKISDMVGLNIRNADTDILRAFIKGQAASNVATGTCYDVDNLAQILLGSTAVTKEYHGAVLFEFEGTLTADMESAYIQLFKNILPAGIDCISVLAYNSNTARYDISYFDEDYYA
jgi:hypothetical protein